jgi:hypothetical protein
MPTLPPSDRDGDQALLVVRVGCSTARYGGVLESPRLQHARRHCDVDAGYRTVIEPHGLLTHGKHKRQGIYYVVYHITCTSMRCTAHAKYRVSSLSGLRGILVPSFRSHALALAHPHGGTLTVEL